MFRPRGCRLAYERSSDMPEALPFDRTAVSMIVDVIVAPPDRRERLCNGYKAALDAHFAPLRVRPCCMFGKFNLVDTAHPSVVPMQWDYADWVYGYMRKTVDD